MFTDKQIAASRENGRHSSGPTTPDGKARSAANAIRHGLLASVFGGPGGKQLKASIMDENRAAPSAVKLAVNGRYPDTVPLATVPPQVLRTLPKLTEDLEYRFIGDSLILLDVRAHLIADFIPDIVPK